MLCKIFLCLISINLIIIDMFLRLRKYNITICLKLSNNLPYNGVEIQWYEIIVVHDHAILPVKGIEHFKDYSES